MWVVTGVAAYSILRGLKLEGAPNPGRTREKAEDRVPGKASPVCPDACPQALPVPLALLPSPQGLSTCPYHPLKCPPLQPPDAGPAPLGSPSLRALVSDLELLAQPYPSLCPQQVQPRLCPGGWHRGTVTQPDYPTAAGGW